MNSLDCCVPQSAKSKNKNNASFTCVPLAQPGEDGEAGRAAGGVLRDTPTPLLLPTLRNESTRNTEQQPLEVGFRGFLQPVKYF